ncbi:MAG TPA: GDSL-type esterase/lipase family protein [Polyangiaceae bacterium]|nr:GDSL-type esterase/lipase family protein [Polyangiaceae bacterium]
MALAKAGPVVALILLVGFAALVPVPARSAEARRSYVVAAIGDSLTDARSGGGLYLQELRTRCPESRFDNYGKGGEMVNQMRHRFVRDVFGDGEGSKPKYTNVIVFGGVNDLYSDLTAGRTVAKITADLSAMYAAANARGVHVIALTVAPWGGFRRYYNPSRAATTAELNRWIMSRPAAGEVDAAVDTYPLLSCGDPEVLCDRYTPPFRDGLHFGLEGHKRIAAALAEQAFADCR